MVSIPSVNEDSEQGTDSADSTETYRVNCVTVYMCPLVLVNIVLWLRRLFFHVDVYMG